MPPVLLIVDVGSILKKIALSRYLSSDLVKHSGVDLFTRFDSSSLWATSYLWRPSLMFDFAIGRLDYGITLHSSSSEKLAYLKSGESCKRLFTVSLSLRSFYNLGVLLLTDSSYCCFYNHSSVISSYYSIIVESAVVVVYAYKRKIY